MRMADLILKKRSGGELTGGELDWMVQEFTAGNLPDYQMSAMLMAVCFQGMNERETAELTLAMARSGDQMDLSGIEGIKVDKHSTGGVGDKTTLIVGPIVAACGVKVAKMSGRGLGHTGGTVDKLESIPGFQVEVDRETFLRMVNRVGIAVVGQSGNLAPADKKLYALRDVTGTVDSIPLIASSIMSKKLAAGNDCIVLDVKTGSGAFMKTQEEAERLAQTMVAIGEHAGRRTVALITDMDRPLGYAVGNAVEVSEAVEALGGNGPDDLMELCLAVAAEMLALAGKGTVSECRRMAEQAIEDGSAKRKLWEMVRAQGGDTAVVEDIYRFDPAPFRKNLEAEESGFVMYLDTEQCGVASMLLGAGREKKEDEIDCRAGIRLVKKTGNRVQKGEVLATVLAGEEEKLEEGMEALRKAYHIGPEAPQRRPLIFARVDSEGIHRQEIFTI